MFLTFLRNLLFKIIEYNSAQFNCDDHYYEMHMNEVFDPTSIYLSDPNSQSLLDPPPVANLPSNLPPNVAQQAWNQVLSGIGTSQGPVLDFELKHAAIESKYYSSFFITKGKIIGCRQPDMNFRIGTPKLSSKWE